MLLKLECSYKHKPIYHTAHKYCIAYLLAPPNLQKQKQTPKTKRSPTSLSVYLYILQYFIHLCKNFTASPIFADGHNIKQVYNLHLVYILALYVCAYLHCDFHSTESTLLKKSHSFCLLPDTHVLSPCYCYRDKTIELDNPTKSYDMNVWHASPKNCFTCQSSHQSEWQRHITHYISHNAEEDKAKR